MQPIALYTMFVNKMYEKYFKQKFTKHLFCVC